MHAVFGGSRRELIDIGQAGDEQSGARQVKNSVGKCNGLRQNVARFCSGKFKLRHNYNHCEFHIEWKAPYDGAMWK